MTKKHRLVANVTQEVIDLVWDIHHTRRISRSKAVEMLILEGAKAYEQNPSVTACQDSATSKRAGVGATVRSRARVSG